MFKRFGETKEDRRKYFRERADEERFAQGWETCKKFRYGNMELLIRSDIQSCLYIDDGIELQFPVSAIVSIDVYLEGAQGSETRRKGMMTRAAVGALSGGTGALIGAMSARSLTRTFQSVTEVGCEIGIDRIELPGIRFRTWYRGILGPLRSDRDRYLLDAEIQKAKAICNEVRMSLIRRHSELR